MFYFARRTKTGGRIVSHDAASSCALGDALSDDRHVPATEPSTWTRPADPLDRRPADPRGPDRLTHVDPTGEPAEPPITPDEKVPMASRRSIVPTLQFARRERFS